MYVQYVKFLKHNLLNISQLYDSEFENTFKPNMCELKQPSLRKIIFSWSRKKKLYILNLDELPTNLCFISMEKDKWIWHKLGW